MLQKCCDKAIHNAFISCLASSLILQYLLANKSLDNQAFSSELAHPSECYVLHSQVSVATETFNGFKTLQIKQGMLVLCQTGTSLVSLLCQNITDAKRSLLKSLQIHSFNQNSATTPLLLDKHKSTALINCVSTDINISKRHVWLQQGSYCLILGKYSQISIVLYSFVFGYVKVRFQMELQVSFPIWVSIITNFYCAAIIIDCCFGPA